MSLSSGRVVGLAFILLVSLAAARGVPEALESITADEIRAHLLLLASDGLEGRAPGTRGADIAAEYIASRFTAVGLLGVDGSYFQDVPLTGVTPDPTSLSVAFESSDARRPAEYPDEAVVWPGAPDRSLQVRGELVFVGYGIHAPAWDWDDYGDAELRNKVLVFLVGDPPAPPDDPGLFDGRAMTYYGRWSYKIEEARRRGATGALIIHREDAAGYDWGVVRRSWAGEQLMLDDRADGQPVLLQGWLREGYARRLLADAGLDLDELMVRAARRDFTPVSTGLAVRSRINSRVRPVRAQNVVGYLPGTSDEVVVYTAHYDHLGRGPAVSGDSVYNGAYDNASGVSVLLELADAFTRLDEPTRRGLVFLATTGEEAGLLGSRHYVRSPMIPLERTAAVLNIDGVSLWGETDDMIALGAERSTLGALLAPHASAMGVQLHGDPAPERGGFFRSDQFAFARAGVPALHLQHGLRFRNRPEGWGDSLVARWNRDHYHQPSDELPPNANLTGAVQQARLLFWLGHDVAEREQRPAWVEPPPAGTGSVAERRRPPRPW